MAMKTVHDLGVAGGWDVCNYTGLSPVEAGWALDALYRKEYLKIVSTKCECDTNEHGEAVNVEVFTLFELTPQGKEAAQGIPDINEPMCIPITNITFGRGSDNETAYCPSCGAKMDGDMNE